MKSVATVAWLAVVGAAFIAAQGKNPKPLDIYVVDAEGGKAVLYVAPTGQTMLIDSGNPGGRDTDRIMAALADAGVTKIDYLISTHYHVDHVGGLEALSTRVPIEHFVDHGQTVEGPVTALREQVAGFQAMYAELSKGKRTVVKPGDRVPIAGLDVRVVTSGGAVLKTPLPGGGKPNPNCATYTPPAEDIALWSTPDDDQSVGVVVALGAFRAIDLGDLLWDRAVQLMCPNNQVGAVDVYFVSGHGTDITSASPLTRGIGARAAVMQNGTRKGGQLAAMQLIRLAPGLEDLWQLHWSYNAGIEQNSAGVYIANVDDNATIAGVLTAPQPGRGRGNAAAHTPAYWIKVSAQVDGTFTISNSRNGFSKQYSRRSTQ